MKNNLFFIKLIYKISPARIILTFVSTFLGFAMWTFSSVIFMQYLFGTADATRSFADVLIFIWFAVGLNIAVNLFDSWYNNVFLPKNDILIQKKLNLMLFEKAQSVDLSCYETPEFYNTYTKAATEASSRAASVLNGLATLVSALISSAFVIITMSRITLWSLLFVALPLVGNLYFGKLWGKVNYEREQAFVPARRKMSYVNRVMYFRKYASDLRLTNLYSVVEKLFSDAVDEIVDVSRKFAFKRSLFSALKSLLMYILGFEGMWICAAVLAINKTISLGDLVVLLNAIVSVSWMLSDVENSLSGVFSNALFIENLRSFLRYTPKIDEDAEGIPLPETIETIEFENVSFVYEGQTKPALDHVSLTLRKGVRHALVGVNGSGKSTLIKLILRFYDPTEGRILLNGIDIRKYNARRYRQKMGVAFQDFALFASSVIENVLLGEQSSEQEREKAISALKSSGIYDKILTLKYKEDSILTKEFDNAGVEFSGGEKQKIAIARAFAKDSAVVILDEPSSALDPIAEYKMFENINELCRGRDKLSLIVSHRLSSAAACEKIFVFDNGILVEQGSHKELMSSNGKYAEMFRKQAQNYLTEEAQYE